MKSHNTQNSFDKTKVSFYSKTKSALNEFNKNNLKETLNIYGLSNNNSDRKNPVINIKLGEKDEYEFPNIKVMQKELIKKIYTKESGEIIGLMRKVNEDIKAQPNYEKIEGKLDSLFNTVNGKFSKQTNCLSEIKNSNEGFHITSNPFYNKQELNEGSETNIKKNEIISIRKMNDTEKASIKSKSFVNKVISKTKSFDLLNQNLNDQNNNFKKSKDFHSTAKSFVNETNNQSSTKNNFFMSKSTTNNFVNSLNHNNFSDENFMFMSQTGKNGFQGFPEHLQKKYNANIKNAVQSWNAINRIFNKRNQGFYCPHCDHCNKIDDENLDQYFAMKEAKGIIQKGFEYICEYYDNDQSFLDFLINLNHNTNAANKNYNMNGNFKKDISNKNDSFSYPNQESFNKEEQNLNKYNEHNNFKIKKIQNRSPNRSIIEIELGNSHFPKGQNNQNYNMNIINGEMENLKNYKKSSKFNLENLLLSYPKSTTDRNVLELVTHFLDALVNDKISLENIVTPEIFAKLKETLIAQGMAFKLNGDELDFDQELDMLFDEKTKEKIRKLFKEKFKHLKKVEIERKEKHEDNLVDIRKRIFIQIISELGAECKEKAVLLYRVFKMFFAEQERKWANITYKIKEKIGYYKDLCKTLIENKNKDNSKIEKINDILFARKLSKENLEDHKALIHDLIYFLNEKRDYTYILKSDIETMNRELNLFVFGFDKIKLDTKIRDKIKEIDVQHLLSNINEEMSHKQYFF